MGLVQDYASDLNKVPIMPFLKTVTSEYLSGLRTFETDSYGSGNNVEEASRLLSNFVGKIVNLEGLAMKCSIRNHLARCFPVIIKHGPNLRLLALRYLHSPQDDPDSHAVLSIKKLTALRSACPNLMRLELDFKLDLKDLEKSGHILTTTLASFRNLRKLSLSTWMSYAPSAADVHDIPGVVTTRYASGSKNFCP